MSVQGTRLPPPPPAGSPADTWDHYLRILPPGELAQRQSAREEINRTVLDAGSREAQVASGARYAHTDAEKEFLQYTGVLPTLDAEVDAGIRERETGRRASVRARRAAREAYHEARETYRERFLAYTGQEPTFDNKQDTAVWDGENTRRKEAVGEWGEQGNALADTFWTESQGRLDSRGGDLGAVDLDADPRYQQWLESEPNFAVLPDGTGGVDNSDYKQSLADYFGQLETGERDFRAQLESAPALGTEVTAVGESGDTVQTYEAYDRDEFLAYTGEEPTGDLAADNATVLRVEQEQEAEFLAYTGEEPTGDLAADKATVLRVEQEQDAEFLAYTGEEPTGDLATDKATVLRVKQEQEAAANLELATVVNSLTPAQQREYETAVFEGQDPYDALKALSERTETQNIHQQGVYERELDRVVNSLTPAQQQEYEAAVFEGQDPYDALKALSERTETQNIHQQGVYERELNRVVNSLTPAQQQEYETAVFEGQDPYDALKALSERTETQNIHQQGVYERELDRVVNSLTPAQQQEYEAAVFEGQDPYDALKALSERTETQNIHQQGVYERELATVVNSLTPAQQQEYETAVFEGQDPYDALKALSERTETQNIHQQGVYERELATVVNSLTHGPAAGIRDGGL